MSGPGSGETKAEEAEHQDVPVRPEQSDSSGDAVANGEEPEGGKSAADSGPRRREFEDDKVRKRAGDPTRRREAKNAVDALSDAVDALRGASVNAHTVIFGGARIGTLIGRDSHTGPSGSGLVPSGKVSATVLMDLENTFVPPPGFAEVRDRLRAQPLLLLRAPQGWGRTATSLRALHESCSAGVHKLNPDVRLRALDIEFTPKTGYLLESLEIEQARTLHVFHLEQLSQKLAEQDCRLVVIVGDKTELSADIEPYLVEAGEPADVAELVRKHLLWRLRGAGSDILDRVEVTSLLAYVAEYRPPARDLAVLAAELAEVAAGRSDIADVVDRHSATVDGHFRQWFDELDGEVRAFAIALAIFNKMPLHIVSSAGRMLAEIIARVETPDDTTPAQPVFGARSAEILDKARAELFLSSEDTEFGRIPVEAARFVDDRYPRRILEYVWQEYHTAHQLVRDWMRELGNDPDLRVCTRVGVAAGLFCPPSSSSTPGS
ncbi:hypothetical protein [Nocardia sp. NPDC059239]|uniref:hypothetical protein n=1 Tax=unclassified Nocardia TaxID=2637762 RepID=UPI00368DF75F